jgi:hypothetical protein
MSADNSPSTQPPQPENTGPEPKSAGEVDPYQQREYEIELEKFERSRRIGPSRLVEPVVERAEPDRGETKKDSSSSGEGVWWTPVDELFAAVDRANAKDLAKAERRAVASGKEQFSLALLEELLQEAPGTWAASEDSLRLSYYIRHSCIRTLAEFAALLREQRMWE